MSMSSWSGSGQLYPAGTTNANRSICASSASRAATPPLASRTCAPLGRSVTVLTPEKIAGRYLAPYLATARPARIGAAPLAERVPVDADAPSDERDAVTLALALADAEARCGNETRALQAFEAARALDPDVPHRAYERAGAEITTP